MLFCHGFYDPNVFFGVFRLYEKIVRQENPIGGNFRINIKECGGEIKAMPVDSTDKAIL